MKNPIITTLLIIFIISSCAEPQKSNELDSDEYETIVERIHTLKNNIKSQSEFNNAEFELYNVNGFSSSRTMIPGASSADYKFVIKVKPYLINKWIDGMIKTKSKQENLAWTKDIIAKRKNHWLTNSTPEFYTREKDNVLMIVYRTEGIIYKRVIIN